MGTYKALATEACFASKTYPAGTLVRIISERLGDGIYNVVFPDGERAMIAAWRIAW